MSDYIIPVFNDAKQVIGINVANVEIPFKKAISFKEFIDTFWDHIRNSFEILDVSKISGDFRNEWSAEELKELVEESNEEQMIILNALCMNKTLTREQILKVIRQVNSRHKNYSARQLGPQIGGIRIRVKNMKKEELISVNSKNQSYTLNETYRKMIKEFVRVAAGPNAIILDFFAGSGTTGHAVMDLNKEDCGKRKFILVTNNENNICRDITYERLKRVIYKDNYTESLKYLKIESIKGP